MKKTLPIIIFVVLFYTSIGLSWEWYDTPKCSDPAAIQVISTKMKKNIWIQLFAEVKIKYLPGAMPAKAGAPTKSQLSNEDAFGMIGDQNGLIMTMMVIGAEETYQQYRGRNVGNRKLIEDLNAMDQRVAKMEFSLSRTRMDKKVPEIKKCFCTGDLSTGQSAVRSVTYSVQKADDGQIVIDDVDLQ